MRRQIGAELIEHGRLALAFLFFFGQLRLALQDAAGGLGAHLVQVDAQAAQDIDGNAIAFTHKPQEQVFRADVMMTHQPRFINSQLKDAFGAWSQVGFPGRHALATAHRPFDGAHHMAGFHSQFLQHFYRHTIFLAYQPQQQVLGADVVVIQALCFLLSQLEHAPCSFGKPIKLVCHDANSFGQSTAFGIGIRLPHMVSAV